MNSYRHSKKSRGPLLLATILVLLVFIIDWLSGGSVRALLRAGASSVWDVGSRAGSVVFGSGFFSTRRALEEENRTLQEELSQLKVRAAAFDVLKEENDALRKVVDLAKGDSGITAPITSSFRSSPYGTFLIGAGTEDGVRVGSLVIAGDPQFGGFLIGHVQAADARASLVKSLFAPGETTDAIVNNVGITLEGHGGGQARGEAPREAVIEERSIVTSALMGGRAIGIVGKVEKDPGGASQRVYVNLPISLTSLKFVYVVEQ